MKEKIFIIIILLVLIGVFIMTGIVHKAVKVSGEKGLATEWNDDHEITGNIDQDQNQFLNQVIENRTDFPAGPVEGQIVYRTDLDITYIFDGTNWSLLNRSVNYWGCPGVNFVPDYPADWDYHYDFQTAELGVTTVAGDEVALASVSLPQGAVITGVVVYGLGAGVTWDLIRLDYPGAGADVTMAAANINVEDTTITSPTIDNITYKYYLRAWLSNNTWVRGARITYTL